jgi:hypothetical protein
LSHEVLIEGVGVPPFISVLHLPRTGSFVDSRKTSKILFGDSRFPEQSFLSDIALRPGKPNSMAAAETTVKC